MSEYKKGDRVRVSFEAEIKHIFADGDLRFELVDHYDTDFPHEATFSIEKVEPPVVTFKPGDVVRRKGSPSSVFAITMDGATEGYVYLPTGQVFGKGLFTSENYELVTL